MWKRKVLYFFLVLQLVMSIGTANEFDDYLFALIFSVLFFVLQIYFLIRAYFQKGVVIFVSIIAFLHLFRLIAFLYEGANSISNKWTAESYNATHTWVLWMFIAAFILDAIKLGVLYRNIILKVVKTMLFSANKV